MPTRRRENPRYLDLFSLLVHPDRHTLRTLCRHNRRFQSWENTLAHNDTPDYHELSKHAVIVWFVHLHGGLLLIECVDKIRHLNGRRSFSAEFQWFVSKVVFLFFVVLGRSYLFVKFVQFPHSLFMLFNVLFDIWIYHWPLLRPGRTAQGGCHRISIGYGNKGGESSLSGRHGPCHVCHADIVNSLSRWTGPDLVFINYHAIGGEFSNGRRR